MRILDPNQAVAFALAIAVAHRFPPPLIAIEAYEELEETKGKLREVLDEPELRRRTPSPSLSSRKKGTPSRALLRSLPLPKIPLGELVVPRLPHRARPHRRRFTKAPGLPRGSSGRGTAARCVAPLPSAIKAAVGRPCLDRRPRLEREIPLCIFHLSRRSENRRLSFNESLWTDELAAVDPVYGPWTYFTDFSIEK
jgi:hypothetical protein